MRTTSPCSHRCCILCGAVFAADAPAKKPAPKPAVWKDAPGDAFSPAPTMADVHYGTHPKQVLHFWKAESRTPTPLLFFIHGGGWTGGNRASGLVGLLPEMLKAGISVVSIEYRFVQEAEAAGVKPPVEWPLHDAAGRLQFVRVEVDAQNGAIRRIRDKAGELDLITDPRLAGSFELSLLSPALDAVHILGRSQALTSADPQQDKLTLTWKGPLVDTKGFATTSTRP